MNGKKKKIFVIILIILIVGGLLFYFFYYRPNRAKNILNQAEKAYEEHNFQEALDGYKQYEAFVGEKNTSADVFDKIGICSYNVYNYDQAVDYYGKSLSKEDNSVVKMSIANAYRDGGETDKAIEIYNSLIKKDPDDIRIYKNLISIYLTRQEYDKAIEVANGYLGVEKKDYPNFKRSGVGAWEMIEILKNILKQLGDEESVKKIDSIYHVKE